MDVRYYDLGRPAPAVTVRNVRFFDLWTALAAELADYYGEKPEGFTLVEKTWNNDDEYAEVVTLNGRIVGALHRPITPQNVAAIWGVNQVEKRAFINRIRSLYNIDGDQLPELAVEQQSKFLADPVRFLLNANDAQSDAIMREIEGRQSAVSRQVEPVAKKPAEDVSESNKAIAAKAGRKKKAAPRIDGQRELLLPIQGGAGAATVRATASPGRKAG
jgi:hypothetical protein